MECDMRPAGGRRGPQRDVADAWLQIQAQVPDIIVRRPLVLAVGVIYFTADVSVVSSASIDNFYFLPIF